MIQENEVITLIISIAGTVFMFANWDHVKKLFKYQYLVIAYLFLVVAWTATILEGIYWFKGFNLIEHGGHAVSCVLLSVWCYKMRGLRDA